MSEHLQPKPEDPAAITARYPDPRAPAPPSPLDTPGLSPRIEFRPSPDRPRPIKIGTLRSEELRLLEIMSLESPSQPLPPRLEDEKAELIKYLDGDREAVRKHALGSAAMIGVTPTAAEKRIASAWREEDKKRASGTLHKDTLPLPRGTILAEMFKGVPPEGYRLALLLQRNARKSHGAHLGNRINALVRRLNAASGETVPKKWEMRSDEIIGHTEDMVGLGDFIKEQLSGDAMIIDTDHPLSINPFQVLWGAIETRADRRTARPAPASQAIHQESVSRVVPASGAPRPAAINTILQMSRDEILNMNDEKAEQQFPREADRNYLWYIQSWLRSNESDEAEEEAPEASNRYRSLLSRMGGWKR